MKSHRFFTYVFFATLLITTGAPAAETLRLSGTGAAIGGMRHLGAAFEKSRPGVRVDVLPSTGSTGGIRAAADGKLDITCASRPLKEEEKKQNLVQEQYAKTGFVFATHQANETPGFKLSEIEDIFAGRRTTWPDGRPIRLILRPLSDTFSLYLTQLSPGMAAAVASAHKIPGVFVAGTDQDSANQIEKVAGSFGLTSTALVNSEKRRVGVLSVDGVPPTDDNIASGRYPYHLPLFLVYRSDRNNGLVKAFVDFVYSEAGREILSKNGHLPLPRDGAVQ